MTQDPGSGTGQPMSERMQSLLSRAVEDQLSEQRQLAGALAEFRAQLGRLSSQLEGQQGGGAAPAPQLEQALGAIAGDVREAVRLLGERLDGVGRLVQQRGHDLAEQRAVLEELKTAVDKHSNALGGMTGGLAALPAFGERIDALQGGLGGLADRLRGLEELTGAVGVLQQRAEALDTGLRELRQAFSGVAARAAQLPAREDIEASTSRVVESVDGLGGRLGRLESTVPSLLERLDAIAESHSGLEESLSSLGDRLDATPTTSGSQPDSADLSVLRDDLGAIRDRLESSDADDDDVQALLDRLDTLQESLLGPDGIAAQVRALVGEGGTETGTTPVDAETVETLVAKAVAESEQRLADHVDEAILTLAEALLRRRPSRRTAGLGAVLGVEEVSSASAPVLDDDPDESEDADESADELDEDLDDEDFDDAEDADEDEADGPRPAWQTPTPAGAPAAEDETTDQNEDGAKKRKPWWRPGG